MSDGIHHSSQENPDQVWRALHLNSDRITALEVITKERQDALRDTITSAVQDAMPKALLTDQQLRWVELAIEREAESQKFRAAVIEKSLGGLIVAMLVFIGAGAWVVLKEFLANHGLKL